MHVFSQYYHHIALFVPFRSLTQAWVLSYGESQHPVRQLQTRWDWDQLYAAGTRASQSPKIHFPQKHKMAASGLVWPQNFLVKKQKLLIFVNHWRSAKSETSDIKNGQVRAIFQFSAFCPLLNWQFQGVNFEWQGHSPLIFVGNFFPINQLDNTHGPSDKKNQPPLMSYPAPGAQNTLRAESSPPPPWDEHLPPTLEEKG